MPVDIQNIIDKWLEITQSFNEPLASILKITDIGYLNDNFIYIICPDVVNLSYIDNHLDIILNQLEAEAGKIFNIKPILDTDYIKRYENLTSSYDSKSDNEESEILKSLLELLNIDSDITIETVD